MARGTAFEHRFEELTGFPPFPWQTRLYQQLTGGDIPPVCDIPTGIGKTMVIPIWLLALAHNKGLPRRLVYVVNRRTIVDQATNLVITMRESVTEALAGQESPLKEVAAELQALDPFSGNTTVPFAASTLRGELADNEEWKSNPAKPAIIVGTVDMIGSKLLFSGYGDSRRTRPLHAGLLGCDCLFVHDEAHLTPAFGKLLRSVQAFATRDARDEGAQDSWIPGISVLELSATHTVAVGNGSAPLLLSADDKADEEIGRRLKASKTLSLTEVEKEGKFLQEHISRAALNYASKSCRVLVFLRKPEDAGKVAEGIQKVLGDIAVSTFAEANANTTLSKKESDQLRAEAAWRVNMLTGEIRGFERDQLLRRPMMQPFLTECMPEETVYLVATSAAEVGMDLHADHMVCDLSTLDSMIQRLGRVNRFGQGNAEVNVAYEATLKDANSKDSGHEKARKATLSFLKRKESESVVDASIASIQEWLEEDSIREAFSPVPEMVNLTSILLDIWAQTSAEGLAASPPPEAWLHGIQDGYPHTFLVWRDEVEDLRDLEKEDLTRWFAVHPPRAAERLQVPTRAITKRGTDGMSTLLKGFSPEKRDATVFILSPRGDVLKTTLGSLTDAPNAARLNYATIVLPAEVAGITEAGFFDPKTTHSAERIDVADGDPRRCLLSREGGTWTYMRLGNPGNPPTAPLPWERLTHAVRHIELEENARAVLKLQVKIADEFAEEDDAREAWLLLLKPLLKQRPSTSTHSPTVEEHSNGVAEIMTRLCEAFPLPEAIRDALVLAAKHHDKGKAAPRWQIAAGHALESGQAPLAKGAVDWRKLDGYRHEAGSLQALLEVAAIRDHPEADLILHCISSHHGWARPHFKPEAFLPGGEGASPEEIAYEAMLRYDRLQRRFGWWGLAWLESLLRRADAVGSAAEQQAMLEDMS